MMSLGRVQFSTSRVTSDYLVHILMNNAAIGGDRTQAGTYQGLDNWKHLMDINFWGVRHGLEAFVPSMIAQNSPAIIVNTGSKQGITV